MRNSPSTKLSSRGRKAPPATPLLALLRALGTAERRAEFAAACGTSTNYLYQIGTCARQACRPALAQRIARGSEVMHRRYGTKVLTVETLLTMCVRCVTE